MNIFCLKAHGWTALHIAVGEGRLDAVSVLMDHVTHEDITLTDKVRDYMYTHTYIQVLNLYIQWRDTRIKYSSYSVGVYRKSIVSVIEGMRFVSAIKFMLHVTLIPSCSVTFEYHKNTNFLSRLGRTLSM